jgi:hypothetical protein
MLGTYDEVGAEDLEEAICAPEVLTAFAAMTILQVRHSFLFPFALLAG